MGTFGYSFTSVCTVKIGYSSAFFAFLQKTSFCLKICVGQIWLSKLTIRPNMEMVDRILNHQQESCQIPTNAAI